MRPNLRLSWIDSTRTICNLLVVVIHSSIVLSYTNDNGVMSRIWEVISGPFSFMAMPALFFISGYLTASGYTLAEYRAKLTRRIRRLIIPYLLWNMIYVFAYIMTASFIPSSACHVSTWNLTSLGGALSKVFALTSDPCDAPLWYVRSLIYLALVAPFIFYIVKRRGVLGVVVISSILLMVGLYGPIAYKMDHQLPIYGVVSYIIGSGFSLNCWNVHKVAFSPAVASIAFTSLTISVCNQIFDLGLGLGLLMDLRVLVIPITLFLGGLVEKAFSSFRFWDILCESSFFIYATHFMACSFCFHLARSVFSGCGWIGTMIGVVSYVFIGLVFILLARKITKNIVPKLLTILEGA